MLDAMSVVGRLIRKTPALQFHNACVDQEIEARARVQNAEIDDKGRRAFGHDCHEIPTVH